MNEIAFVIAVDDFGVGELEGLEPVIDGVSVVDLLKWQDGEISFAGLVPPERFLPRS